MPARLRSGPWDGIRQWSWTALRPAGTGFLVGGPAGWPLGDLAAAIPRRNQQSAQMAQGSTAGRKVTLRHTVPSLVVHYMTIGADASAAVARWISQKTEYIHKIARTNIVAPPIRSRP